MYLFRNGWRSVAIIGLLVAVPLFTSETWARGGLLAQQTAASWNGPESKVICTKTGSMTGFRQVHKLKFEKTTWKTCTEWKTVLKEHRLVATMYGPNNISNPDEQLKTISKACLASGLVFAGVPALATGPISGDISGDLIRKGTEICLKTQNLLSEIVAPGFEITLDHSSKWE
jgi:hypothetical protein